VVGDYNGDGKPDLATCNYAVVGVVSVMIGNGNGNFASPVNYSAGSYAGLLMSADLDGDGKTDLLVPNTKSASVAYLLGNGDGTFGVARGVGSGSGPGGITVGDFDGDGKPDVAVSSTTYDSVVVSLNKRANFSAFSVSSGVLTLSSAAGPITLSENAGILSVNTSNSTDRILAANITSIVLSGAAVTVSSDLGGVGGSGSVGVTVNTGASIVFNASQHLTNLIVNGFATTSPGGGKVLRVTGLAIGATAKIDLNDSDLIYDYAGVTPQQAATRNLIAPAWMGGAWIGPGITSTAAKNSVGRRTGLGYMEAADYKAIYGASATFDGETIDSTAVLVKYTLYGDADFNRTVDFNDFLKLQNGFGGTNGSFAQGDFDYNGVTDFNDFLILQNNFNQTLAAALPGSPAPANPAASPTPAAPQSPAPSPISAPSPAGTASIAGVLFRDNNQNGKFDRGDGVGRGAMVYLDLDDDGVKDANEPSAIADSSGKFTFKNLVAGKYRVRQMLAKGTVDSTPARYVTLARGQAAKGVLLGSRAK
ncbi:MAG: putative Ig proteinputative calcium-binding proteinFG-GAP repeat protein, partial [Phycisphaerales bacterium]|nr:putative Ig proteinputative calcium-binding proteinFG-GAP repeat protein [Phycisphaerales bacterium]